MQRHVLRTLYAIHLTFGNSRSDGFSASGRGRQGAVQTRAAEQELPRSANRKVMKCGIAVSMKFTQQRHRVFQPLTSDAVCTADCSIAAPVVCCTTRQRRGSNREPRACPPSPLSFGAAAPPGPATSHAVPRLRNSPATSRAGEQSARMEARQSAPRHTAASLAAMTGDNLRLAGKLLDHQCHRFKAAWATNTSPKHGRWEPFSHWRCSCGSVRKAVH